MITYVCDTCGTTATDWNGWLVVAVSALHIDTSLGAGGANRVTDKIYPDLIFDKKQCRDTWLDKAGLPKP